MPIGTVLLWLGLMFVFLILNAVFVAAEYALVKLRRSRVQELVDDGNRAARTVAYLQENIGTTIAGTQLGITLMSLALGWVGEKSIHDAVKMLLQLVPVLANVEPPPGLAFGLSFVVLSMLHVIIGEQVPKSWSLRLSEKTALTLAPFVQLFCVLTWPFLWVMTRLASLVLRCLGLPKTSEEEIPVHSADELGILIEASHKAGSLGKQESDLLRRALELKELTVKQVMIPRVKIDRIAENLTLAEVLSVVSKTKHSKLPVFRGNDDNVIGVLNTPDLFDWWYANTKTPGVGGAKEFRLSSFVRQAYFVPDSMPASTLLEEMRARKIQMAIVVDEFGAVVGLVALEDLLEQLVGDIWDEYDSPQPGVESLGKGRWRISADLTLLEFNKALNAEVSCCGSCTTIAGVVIEALGRVPHVGDTVDVQGLRFTIASMRGHAIEKLDVEQILPVPLPQQATATLDEQLT